MHGKLPAQNLWFPFACFSPICFPHHAGEQHHWTVLFKNQAVMIYYSDYSMLYYFLLMLRPC